MSSPSQKHDDEDDPARAFEPPRSVVRTSPSSSTQQQRRQQHYSTSHPSSEWTKRGVEAGLSKEQKQSSSSSNESSRGGATTLSGMNEQLKRDLYAGPVGSFAEDSPPRKSSPKPGTPPHQRHPTSQYQYMQRQQPHQYDYNYHGWGTQLCYYPPYESQRGHEQRPSTQQSYTDRTYASQYGYAPYRYEHPPKRLEPPSIHPPSTEQQQDWTQQRHKKEELSLQEPRRDEAHASKPQKEKTKSSEAASKKGRESPFRMVDDEPESVLKTSPLYQPSPTLSFTLEDTPGTNLSASLSPMETEFISFGNDDDDRKPPAVTRLNLSSSEEEDERLPSIQQRSSWEPITGYLEDIAAFQEGLEGVTRSPVKSTSECSSEPRPSFQKEKATVAARSVAAYSEPRPKHKMIRSSPVETASVVRPRNIWLHPSHEPESSTVRRLTVGSSHKSVSRSIEGINSMIRNTPEKVKSKIEHSDIKRKQQQSKPPPPEKPPTAKKTAEKPEQRQQQQQRPPQPYIYPQYHPSYSQPYPHAVSGRARILPMGALHGPGHQPYSPMHPGMPIPYHAPPPPPQSHRSQTVKKPGEPRTYSAQPSKSPAPRPPSSKTATPSARRLPDQSSHVTSAVKTTPKLLPRQQSSEPIPTGGGKENTETKSEQRAEKSKVLLCNCKKSNCLKMYCVCFSGSRFCNGCNCVDCQNTEQFSVIRNRAIKEAIAKNRGSSGGCKCKRSQCLKKYCECFGEGVVCSSKCKCIDCKNRPGSQNLIDKRRKMKDVKGTEYALKLAQEVWKPKSARNFPSAPLSHSSAVPSEMYAGTPRSAMIAPYTHAQVTANPPSQQQYGHPVRYSPMGPRLPPMTPAMPAPASLQKKQIPVASKVEPSKTIQESTKRLAKEITPSSTKSIQESSKRLAKEITPSAPTVRKVGVRLPFDPSLSRKRRKKAGIEEHLSQYFGSSYPAQPKTAVLCIFGYLSNKDLYQAAQVCKSWSSLALDEELWSFNPERK